MNKKIVIAGAAVVVLAAVIAVPRIFTGEEIGEYESRPTVEVQKAGNERHCFVHRDDRNH